MLSGHIFWKYANVLLLRDRVVLQQGVGSSPKRQGGL